MNDQYSRFEPSYLDQEPAIILDQNPQNNQRSNDYIQNYEYEQQQQQQQQNQQNQSKQGPGVGHQRDGNSVPESDQKRGLQSNGSEEPQVDEVGDSGNVDNGVVGGGVEGDEGEDLMGDSVFSNVGQGLTGQYRNMMMAYWQETINSIEHEEHDFKNHQLPLARIKKVMKTDEEVRMISAEAPILFAKGCDIFITELTMRAWIHAEENKRRTLQRSDIAAALQKSDMFDFLIDIVPREEVLGNGSGGGGQNSKKSSNSRQNSSVNPNYPPEYQGSYLSQAAPTSTGGAGPGYGMNSGNSGGVTSGVLKNDNERDDENYQYNDMNVYENRY